MKFLKTNIIGAWKIEINPIIDDRGFFARTFCATDFQKHGLEFNFLQQSVSYNIEKGTLRGMHFQSTPYEESKLVSVNKGHIFDVILDLRPSSSSYLMWQGFELSDKNYSAIYIPKGVAHGFQCLVDDTVVFYQMTQKFESSHSCGVRWNDPTFGISWPLKARNLSNKDKNYPNYKL